MLLIFHIYLSHWVISVGENSFRAPLCNSSFIYRTILGKIDSRSRYLWFKRL